MFVINVSPHDVDLDSGRVLATGERAEVDDTDRHDQLIEDGLLAELDALAESVTADDREVAALAADDPLADAEAAVAAEDPGGSDSTDGPVSSQVAPAAGTDPLPPPVAPQAQVPAAAPQGSPNPAIEQS